MQILERLIDGLRSVCGAFPDKRSSSDVRYSMADIGAAAFSLFFMQSESFLAHQRTLEDGRGTSNCATLFGVSAIPTDNHIRSMLDPVPPSCLQPVFDQALTMMHDEGGLDTFRCLGDRLLIAIDGTEYFCSQKLGCPHCLTRKRSNGKTENYHSMLAATIVAPGSEMAFPLMPEFIARQDGMEKQDCERNAAKRWLATHGERLKSIGRPIYLGDDLFACQPIAEAIIAQGADFLFTAKLTSHKTLYGFMEGGTPLGRVETQKSGRKRLTTRYRWFSGVPMRDAKDALTVNWIGVTVTDVTGKTIYENGFVTSLAVTEDNVAELVSCARARWKIENESFNVLKSNGYHLEHNFGHGQQNLAMLFAAMNMLAFAFHTVCDCLEKLWKNARTKKGSRKRFFEHVRVITTYLVFPNWKIFMETLISSMPPPEIVAQAAA